MDTLGSHKVAGVRAAIEPAGCRVLYRPPSGPDLSPVAVAFSELKRELRKAAERTVEGLWAAIGRRPDRFRPDECRAYLRHAGYNATPN